MNKLFDLDYLCKDLTGNAEIQSAVDRGLAFMKLEKWDKALQVFDELIDLHPESPCGWFGKARLATNNYTVYDLTSEGGRTLVAEAATNLEAAIKLVEDERKDEYLRLQATFSDYMKKYLVDCYVNSFSAFVDVCENVATLFSDMNHRMFMTCDAFSKASANEEGGFREDSIYSIPTEIIIETGNDYPSIRFAAVHIIIMNEVMKFYFEAQNKQAHAKRVQEARFEQRKSWNSRQGFGYALDSNEIKELSALCPVYELSHYYSYDLDSKWSLAKLIKDNTIFKDAPLNDEKVQLVFRAYFKLFKAFNIPVGDLKGAGVPDKYYDEIEADLQKQAEQEKAEREKRNRKNGKRYGRKKKKLRLRQQKQQQKSLLKLCCMF